MKTNLYNVFILRKAITGIALSRQSYGFNLQVEETVCMSFDIRKKLAEDGFQVVLNELYDGELYKIIFNNSCESRVRYLAKAQQFNVFYPLVKTNGNWY